MSTPQNIQMENSTYEIVKKRLQTQADDLRKRLHQLNDLRKEVFGSRDMVLLANDRITTENNCIPRDMVAMGNHFLFGYNVHIGLRTEVKLSDVFSMYSFDPADHSFHQGDLTMINDQKFAEEFHNLYKYYKSTVFVKFAVIGPFLFMVFQIGKSKNDIKTFKWAIGEGSLTYIGNRFDHEFRFPDQHEFDWVKATRDMHRRGLHPHVSIMDRLFVETVGGDLTIKIEDNTDDGRGIYEELVDNKDQTLDDADIYFADLGNLIALKIRPYQEKAWRYIIFNEKMQEAVRVDSIEKACVRLPDDQGIIFSNGYYLQTGEYKIFDNIVHDLQFEKRVNSSNGEDYLFTFYDQEAGVYALLPYNLVEQKVETPILCSGYTIFPDGELCYFRAENEANRNHLVQVWQTPYGTIQKEANAEANAYIFKVGNKDLVRGMAECNELLTLIGRGDKYGNLYTDLVKKTTDILDTYYWINHADTGSIDEPLAGVRKAASAAIDEFEKVRKMRHDSEVALKAVEEKVNALFDQIRRSKPTQIDHFVNYLSDLRVLTGEIISLKDLRYIHMSRVEEFEKQVLEKSDELSQRCVDFLLGENSLNPYVEKLAHAKTSVANVTKVAEADEAAEEIDQIALELELLIDIVNNLKIDDATQTVQIIDHISDIYTGINTLRASLKTRRKELRGTEAVQEFHAQLKLLDQGLVNYLDLCDTVEKCEEYLTKLMIQVEELEGKFSEFDNFIPEITEKREEIYQAFETRKLYLLEKRNKRTTHLMTAAERILQGVRNRLSKFKEVNDINAYFAADLMIAKIRDMIEELSELGDAVKSGDLQTRLKTLREEAIRQLKDRTDLFTEGENIIRLGRHHFSVSERNLDLTVVNREGEMCFHLTGTNFFEPITDQEFRAHKSLWNQSLISENTQVYRAEYLAFQMLKTLNTPEDYEKFDRLNLEEKQKRVSEFMKDRYQEGYIKGIHDVDTAAILDKLIHIHRNVGLLRYRPEPRALAAVFWHSLSEKEADLLNRKLKAAGLVLSVFPDLREFESLLKSIRENLKVFVGMNDLFDNDLADEASEYIFFELASDDHFIVSREAKELFDQFFDYLKKKKSLNRFRRSMLDLKEAPVEKFSLIKTWLNAYTNQLEDKQLGYFTTEAAAMIWSDNLNLDRIVDAPIYAEVSGLSGEHNLIDGGVYKLNYHDFMLRLNRFENEIIPAYQYFTQLKKRLTAEFKQQLRLEEFKPRVLTSFVRNKLIDELYLPIIGDNLAKQMGTVGENTRTDRMGMLLLISPPGYGKTTLMEYVANRLGLIFMKINGPAIGHQVTSLDPSEAPNASAREELDKLNLAFEMGDNVMIYLDDIQHCNPEFLQKFISLCDAQRKIEGVYKGQTRTYDLRGKKVSVVMAGNPYTESGEKFRIPDMLANRADTYNLGDILGDNGNIFKLSYLENALTSNPALNRLTTCPQEDVYTLIDMAENGTEGASFQTAFSGEEIAEYVSVLKKLLVIRDVILKVNQAYIHSAGQADEFRTEPAFLLQGSYRNMNKLAEKVAPIMNDAELKTLILSHYEGESQTLTTGAEANLLKFKAMNDWQEENENARWAEICRIYREQKTLSADRLAQLVKEMGNFTEGLSSIKDVLEKGMNGVE
jgi:MoxR-like ATPase